MYNFLNSIEIALPFTLYIIYNLKIQFPLYLALLNYLKISTLFITKLLISFLLEA